MKRLDVAKLKEADILAGRNLVSGDGKAIRVVLGSESDHNALIIRHNTRGWGIGDMYPPEGVFDPFSKYEDLVEAGDYEISIYRIVDITDQERRLMSYHWQEDIAGLDYSEFCVKRLWVLRFANCVPWTIQGTWCTRAIGTLCRTVLPDNRNPFRKIHADGMPLKRNETPRTVEKRVIQRLLIDVTDEVFH